MIKIMGGDKNSEPFLFFTDQIIKAFLAVRDHAEEIYSIIYLMSKSGMKCYKPPSMNVIFLIHKINKYIFLFFFWLFTNNRA